MARHGKAYRDRIKLVDKTQMLPLTEAISLLRKVKFAKFDETINLDLRLGVDPRNQDQQVRGTVALPHGTGKVVRVAVFAKGEKQKEAEDAGADIVGGDELAEKVLAGFLDFDKAIATPDMMRVVGRLGKVLGPRNMMPNPKAGTVTMDIRGAVEGLKAGRVEYRVDRLANMHIIVGKSSFSDEQLHENISALMTAIWKAKPASAKGRFIRSVTLSSVMSPGIRLDMSTGEGTVA